LEARVSGSGGCGGLESQGHGGEELCCQHMCEDLSDWFKVARLYYEERSVGAAPWSCFLEAAASGLLSSRQRSHHVPSKVPVMQPPIPFRVELQPGVTPGRVLPSVAAQDTGLNKCSR
jgi:hypothetical protein